MGFWRVSRLTLEARAARRSGLPMPPRRPLLVLAAGCGIVCGIGVAPEAARAQNDWQYPDPYFGIIEIEGSRRPAADRRPWVEPRPAPPQPPAAARRPRWTPRRHRVPAAARGAP